MSHTNRGLCLEICESAFWGKLRQDAPPFFSRKCLPLQRRFRAGRLLPPLLVRIHFAGRDGAGAASPWRGMPPRGGLRAEASSPAPRARRAAIRGSGPAPPRARGRRVARGQRVGGFPITAAASRGRAPPLRPHDRHGARAVARCGELCANSESWDMFGKILPSSIVPKLRYTPCRSFVGMRMGTEALVSPFADSMTCPPGHLLRLLMLSPDRTLRAVPSNHWNEHTQRTPVPLSLTP